MEAYWSQYREHCRERAEKSAAALESLRRQQLALIDLGGNPLWIAALVKDIAEARHSIAVYEAVVARLDANEQPTG